MLQEKANKIIERFEKYQGDKDRDEMEQLYRNLVSEEKEEYHASAIKGNTVGVYDAIADIYRVTMLRDYLWCSKRTSPNLKHSYYYNIDETLLCDLLDEVIKSNYTKSLGTEEHGEKKGKVIKGLSYVKPDIESVLKRHGILPR